MNAFADNQIKKFVFRSHYQNFDPLEVFEYYRDYCMDRIYQKPQVLKGIMENSIPKALLATIIKRLCIDCSRSRDFKQNFYKRDREINDSLIHFEDNFQKEELIALMHRCMNQLSNKDRVLLQLFYLQEYSYNEIAEKIDLKKKSIGQSIHRAKKRLKDIAENAISTAA
jgi:RNA polymerase sigma-70 factor (ECF subfamily)